MNETMNHPGTPPPLDPSVSPLAYSRQLRSLRDWVRAEIKLADERAVRQGQNERMSPTQIGAAIGATAQHVYTVLSRMQEDHTTQ